MLLEVVGRIEAVVEVLIGTYVVAATYCVCASVVGVHLSMGGAEEWYIAIAKVRRRDCFGDHTVDF